VFITHTRNSLVVRHERAENHPEASTPPRLIST
jgi:hypothetical protein